MKIDQKDGQKNRMNKWNRTLVSKVPDLTTRLMELTFKNNTIVSIGSIT